MFVLARIALLLSFLVSLTTTLLLPVNRYALIDAPGVADGGTGAILAFLMLALFTLIAAAVALLAGRHPGGRPLDRRTGALLVLVGAGVWAAKFAV